MFIKIELNNEVYIYPFDYEHKNVPKASEEYDKSFDKTKENMYVIPETLEDFYVSTSELSILLLINPVLFYYLFATTYINQIKMNLSTQNTMNEELIKRSNCVFDAVTLNCIKHIVYSQTPSYTFIFNKFNDNLTSLERFYDIDLPLFTISDNLDLLLLDKLIDMKCSEDNIYSTILNKQVTKDINQPSSESQSHSFKVKIKQEEALITVINSGVKLGEFKNFVNNLLKLELTKQDTIKYLSIAVSIINNKLKEDRLDLINCMLSDSPMKPIYSIDPITPLNSQYKEQCNGLFSCYTFKSKSEKYITDISEDVNSEENAHKCPLFEKLVIKRLDELLMNRKAFYFIYSSHKGLIYANPCFTKIANHTKSSLLSLCYMETYNFKLYLDSYKYIKGDRCISFHTPCLNTDMKHQVINFIKYIDKCHRSKVIKASIYDDNLDVIPSTISLIHLCMEYTLVFSDHHENQIESILNLNNIKETVFNIISKSYNTGSISNSKQYAKKTDFKDGSPTIELKLPPNFLKLNINSPVNDNEGNTELPTINYIDIYKTYIMQLLELEINFIRNSPITHNISNLLKI